MVRARYLAALEAEVLPFVESRYRTAPSRLLAGHSLGGLFTTYALVNRPDLFNGYIALSPSYHHGRDLIGQMADFLSHGIDRPCTRAVYGSGFRRILPHSRCL